MKKITYINITGFTSYVKKFSIKNRKIILNKSLNLFDKKDKLKMQRQLQETFLFENVSCIDEANLYYPNPGPDSIIICGKNSLILADKMGANALGLDKPNFITKKRDNYYKRLALISKINVNQRHLSLNDLKNLKKIRNLLLTNELNDEDVELLSKIIETMFESCAPIKLSDLNKNKTSLRKKSKYSAILSILFYNKDG